MPRFRRKATIEAMCVPPTMDIDARMRLEGWLIQDNRSMSFFRGSGVVCVTNHGESVAQIGDWIMREADGDLYPIANENFRKMYEAVE